MRILDWYRVDRSAPMRRALAWGACLMAAGSLVIGLSFLARQPVSVRWLAAAVGFVSIVSAPIVALLGLRNGLREDRYIAVLPEGVWLHLEGDGCVVQWDTLARVAFDADHDALVFSLRAGDELRVERRFAGVTNRDLAARLDTARRKASFHLL